MLLLLATVLLGWRRAAFADLGVLAATATAGAARQCLRLRRAVESARPLWRAPGLDRAAGRRAAAVPAVRPARTAADRPQAGSPARSRPSPCHRHDRPTRPTGVCPLISAATAMLQAALAPGSTCVPSPLAALAALLALSACAGFDRPRASPSPVDSGRGAASRLRHRDRMGGQEPLPAVPPRGRFPAPRRSPTAPAASSPPSTCSSATPAAAAGRRTRSIICASMPPARCWTPASATASAKTISRRRPIWSSRGSPARCRPARPATGASTTAPSRRKQVNAPCSAAGAAARSPTASRPSPRSASPGRTTASTASRPRSRCAIS